MVKGGDVSVKDVDEWKGRLPSILTGHELEDIYNVDETGLFYWTIPSKSLTVKTVACKGGKLAKDRVIFLFCGNVVGNKEPPLMIEKSERPSCFKNVNMNVLAVK